MATTSGESDRRGAADAIGRRVQQAILSGPENAEPLNPDQLRLLNGAGFFTRAQVEHFADRIREADRLLEEVLSSPTLQAADTPGDS